MIDPGLLPPPERLLVTLVRRRDVQVLLAEDRAVIDGPRERAWFFGLAMEHGIHGLVLRALIRSPLMTTLPLETAQGLTAEWNRLRKRAALWDLERDRLLSQFEHQGLTPVVLKGGALRETGYVAQPLAAIPGRGVVENRCSGDLCASVLDPSSNASRLGYRANGSG